MKKYVLVQSRITHGTLPLILYYGSVLGNLSVVVHINVVLINELY